MGAVMEMEYSVGTWYMEWSCRDPQTSKLKPLVLNIIKFFAVKYEEREDEDEATVLEQLAGEWRAAAGH